MTTAIEPTGEACGAYVTGIDLNKPLDDAVVRELRAAWLEHHVLIFPDQVMDTDDLERFSLSFGPFGEDPFIKPIEGRKHVIAIRREADETSRIFADVWHTDWSFQVIPPAGTCLMGVDIPPTGGDTLFADQHLALQQMSPELRTLLEKKLGVHSAVLGYSRGGTFTKEREDRSMDIESSEEALKKQLHPIIRKHPESGKEGIFGTARAYLIGIDGMEDDAAMDLLLELHKWQTQEQFVYRHKWQNNMLVMWDNRSVLHRATGGYEGHRRELFRTTVADSREKYLAHA